MTLQDAIYEAIRDAPPQIDLSEDEVATLADRLAERGVGMVAEARKEALEQAISTSRYTSIRPLPCDGADL